MMIQYRIGQAVYHTRFGRGIVQDITDDNPPIITVDFGGTHKELVYDENLQLRMTVRGAKPASNNIEESKTVSVSPKASFFSSLMLPSTVEIKQFEGMERFHFKYKGTGFLVIDLKNDCYQLRTKEAYLKAIGVYEYDYEASHPTNPAKIKSIPYSDTTILKRVINYVVSGTILTGINQGKEPARITQNDGHLQFVCPTCGVSFIKAKRCPECGQLILFDATSIHKIQKRILHVGDDVSRLRIYEILNKYFGTNYSGWMKAGYGINENYWAWFPIITKTNTRPNGTYGGTAMWSNTLSPDRRTLITINHDELNKPPKPRKIKQKALIFARISGVLQFIGVFEEHHVPEAKNVTYQYDRVAQGIDLDTFELIDED